MSDALLAEAEALIARKSATLDDLLAERERTIAHLTKIEDALRALGGARMAGTVTDRILRFVLAHPGCTSRQIALAVGGLDRQAIASALATRGRLRREKKNGCWHFYVPAHAPTTLTVSMQEPREGEQR